MAFYNPLQNYGTGLDMATDFGNPPPSNGGGRGGSGNPLLDWIRGFRFRGGNGMNGQQGMQGRRVGYDLNPFDNRRYMLPSTYRAMYPTTWENAKPQPGGIGYEEGPGQWNKPQPGGIGNEQGPMMQPQTGPSPFFNGGQGTAWDAVPTNQRNQFLPPLVNGRRTWKPPQRVY